jgi:hypothetical protein
MIYAKKKVAVHQSTAQQNAQIIATVKALQAKNLIQFEKDTVLFYPEIWKDKNSAINWIKCIYIYCCLKKHIKIGMSLDFKNIQNNELVGTMTNGHPKILIAI